MSYSDDSPENFSEKEVRYRIQYQVTECGTEVSGRLRQPAKWYCGHGKVPLHQWYWHRGTLWALLILSFVAPGVVFLLNLGVIRNSEFPGYRAYT
jgi:multimeric flavodoxin WrbA